MSRRSTAPAARVGGQRVPRPRACVVCSVMTLRKHDPKKAYKPGEMAAVPSPEPLPATVFNTSESEEMWVVTAGGTLETLPCAPKEPPEPPEPPVRPRAQRR